MLEKLCQRAGILQARPEQEDTLHPGVHAGGMPDFEYGMLPGWEEVADRFRQKSGEKDGGIEKSKKYLKKYKKNACNIKNTVI